MATTWDVSYHNPIMFLYDADCDWIAWQLKVYIFVRCTIYYISFTLFFYRYFWEHLLDTIVFFFSLSMTPAPTFVSVDATNNNSSLPPALPPKRSRSIKSNSTPPPISPKPTISMQSIRNTEPLVTSTPLKLEEPAHVQEKKDVTPSTPVKSVNIDIINWPLY